MILVFFTVVYQISDCIYLVGEDAGKSNASYAVIFNPDGGQFLALSNKYMLFLTKAGKTAIAFEQKKDVKVGESYLIKIPFEDLSDEEKEAFVYPTSYEK